jgi:BirA family transcriptional regulator, biotin operon repressor / biotin---[acetyl-CoA-carboxylase] ligase
MSPHPPWLHWLETVPSTNSWAIDHPQQLQHGDVVFTPRQTAGRGQFDRVWQAPPGVVTVSFVLDGWSEGKSLGFSLGAGLAIIYGIEDLLKTPNLLQLKWPNDVWHQGRKLAGILCEQRGQRLIVGVGCNRQVDFTAAQISGNPVSLHQISTPPPTDLELVTAFRHYLLEAAALVQDRGLEKLLPALGERDALRGRSLKLAQSDGSIIEGIGAGINGNGRLQIQTGEKIQAFASGQLQL